jgi:hypothetical protein
MNIPEPVTPPERDTGFRAPSIYNLEVTLVRFIEKLFGAFRLDNPTLNLSQATGPQPLEPRIVQDPDQPPVSYDPTTRAQTLALKVPPRVERGGIPKTVTGEIPVDKLPDCPAIIVQAISAKAEATVTLVRVRILVSCYDENPDASGDEDVQNILEMLTQALTTYGQRGIDLAYPIVMPIEWKLIEHDVFPHFLGELVTHFEMSSARPLPDPATGDFDPFVFGIVPAEQIELRGEAAAPDAELIGAT